MSTDQMSREEIVGLVCENVQKGCRYVSVLVDSGACGTPGPMSLISLCLFQTRASAGAGFEKWRNKSKRERTPEGRWTSRANQEVAAEGGRCGWGRQRWVKCFLVFALCASRRGNDGEDVGDRL
jgi:hypothetical protein